LEAIQFGMIQGSITNSFMKAPIVNIMRPKIGHYMEPAKRKHITQNFLLYTNNSNNDTFNLTFNK